MAEINRLSARGVAALTEPGRHADGGNLYLNISKSGARSWILLYRRDGKQREMGLGPAGPGGVSLALAREMAADGRRLLALGQDPLTAKRASKAEAKAAQAALITFGEFATSYIANQEPAWKNQKHVAQWKMTILGPQVQKEGKAMRKLGPDYCSDLRKRPVAEVNTDDVQRVIGPILKEKRETGNRIRQRIEAILNAAMVQGLRPESLNPARWRGHLAVINSSKTSDRPKGHFKSLPWKQMPDFMAALSLRDGVSARALELLILTAARSGEVRGMTWEELDLAEATWSIPGNRMKMGKPHRVPLCDRAIATVEGMIPLMPRLLSEQPKALVFPGLRRAPLSDMTLGAVLRRMGVDVTVHGFRSSFRTWGSEATSSSFEVLESALAHAPSSAVVESYQRGDHWERRIELMRAWEALLAADDKGVQAAPLRAAEV
jgi:integrase